MDAESAIIMVYFWIMIRNFRNRGFLIPMVASIILLPCFLAYFLKSEFKKEKEAMVLEERDNAFSDFFSQIDTLTNSSLLPHTGGIISWMKDSSGSDVSYKLRIVSDSISDFGSAFKIRGMHPLEFEQGLDFGETRIDSNSRRGSRDTIITIVSDLSMQGDRGYSEIGIHSLPVELTESDNPSNLELIKRTDKSNKQFFSILQDDISLGSVINRMLPQIIFSFFLLASVLVSFFLIARSLRRERQLSEMRNDFMSNMSHELKTPVSTIAVALEALSNFDAGNNPELRKEYINISKLEVERLGLLVDKSLNISLHEQGKFVYEKQQINLDQEISKILKTLQVQLDNQNVTLDYKTDGSNFLISADRTHMVNVIYNLIENGIKYSESQAEISINLIEEADSVVILLADKGRGIPKEYQDKVFEKFFRVPQGNTHNIKGHGLGLSYVKEVIEGQGGTIHLKSALEQGTTFIIKMPKKG